MAQPRSRKWRRISPTMVDEVVVGFAAALEALGEVVDQGEVCLDHRPA